MIEKACTQEGPQGQSLGLHPGEKAMLLEEYKRNLERTIENIELHRRIALKKLINEVFTYHAPTGDQPQRYDRLRSAAREFAEAIAECCPESADRTHAIRKLRECVMMANASIALSGRSIE